MLKISHTPTHPKSDSVISNWGQREITFRVHFKQQNLIHSYYKWLQKVIQSPLKARLRVMG